MMGEKNPLNQSNASSSCPSWEKDVSKTSEEKKDFAEKNGQQASETQKPEDLIFCSATSEGSSETIKKRRLYSRRGDLGETSLCFGPRVGKDHLRVVACGTLDELNSFLGLARSENLSEKMDALLLEIQKKLFVVSAELMTFNPQRHEIQTLQSSDVLSLESLIDSWDNKLPSLQLFLIPGGCRSAALLNVARTICRRAEQQVVALIRKDETVSRTIIAWLNRLSDLLFVLARTENILKQNAEIIFRGP